MLAGVGGLACLYGPPCRRLLEPYAVRGDGSDDYSLSSGRHLSFDGAVPPNLAVDLWSLAAATGVDAVFTISDRFPNESRRLRFKLLRARPDPRARGVVCRSPRAFPRASAAEATAVAAFGTARGVGGGDRRRSSIDRLPPCASCSAGTALWHSSSMASWRDNNGLLLPCGAWTSSSP